MSKEYTIPISKEIQKKLSIICKFLGIDMDKLIKLAFNELFELILSEPSIFLEKIGIIDNLKKIASGE